MTVVRLAVIGLGNMGAAHARRVVAGEIPGLTLVAVCDTEAARLAEFSAARAFSAPEELFAARAADAVLIATPHYSHRPLALAALRAGLHVLVEKPVAVHVAEFDELSAGYVGHEQQVFAAVFNQRTDPAYRRIRELIRSGELGAVRRWQWTITDWFRTERYYRSGGWRATWAGEGGGVLLNQCPHNLDLAWWLFGAPARVRAHCHFGKFHRIEVEDEVTAYLEYADGATGTFIASTGEAPGTNRLEIAAEMGRIVLERGRLTFTRNAQAMGEFSRTSDQMFAAPGTTEEVFEFPEKGLQHVGILQNFAAAILRAEWPIAPALEGRHSVELANAMLLSTWQDRTVSLPLDGRTYAAELTGRSGAAAAFAATRS